MGRVLKNGITYLNCNVKGGNITPSLIIENPFLNNTITILNPVKTTVESSSVTDGVGQLNLRVDADNSREGTNIQLDNLQVGYQYTLRLDMQMTSGNYLYSGYSQGITISDTPITEYALSGGAQIKFIEDLSNHSYCISFCPLSSTMYLIVYLVDVTNATQYFTMSNIELYKVDIPNLVTPFEYKTYLKFNGTGITLPWTLNADYKVEVVFHETTYVNNAAIIGNTGGNNYSHLTEYSNKYYTSTGTSETSFGAWAAGEHTFINNNGNNKNEFDEVEVTDYTPRTSSDYYAIGSRKNATNYSGWIKSYKIYSISNDTLLHNLIPAISNGVSGFYDNVEGKMYIVQGASAVDTIS